MDDVAIDHLVACPELTYSTSESANSPNSNSHQESNQESDWLKWPQEEDSLSFDPLFSLADDDLGIVNALSFEPFVDDVQDRITADAILTGPHELNKEYIFQETSPVSIDTTSGKRKLSDSSDEHTFDRRSNSGISLSSADHGASRSVSPVRKKTANGLAKPPKVSHNVIEKRYRSNLNDKIFELRNSVPALKAEADSGNAKHPKGKIITGATSYIQQLEAANLKLRRDNERLTAKLRASSTPTNSGVISKLVVGGLAGMVALSGPGTNSDGREHSSKAMGAMPLFGLTNHHVHTVTKILLIFGAIAFVFFPDFLSLRGVKSKPQARYSQSTVDDCLQEDIQEHREAFHSNVSAMLEMPCDRPGLFKRILQGIFLLSLEIMLGESWWNRLINRGLDYAMTRQRACQMLIESQLLGGDKSITKAKLLLSAIQSLGYKMNKEIRAIHFAMVCHGVLSAAAIRWCIGLFWNVNTDDSILAMPLEELLDSRILDAFWRWTTGVEDGLLSNIRSDPTIENPLRQLSSIHAARLQSEILREWLRGTVTTSELDRKMARLMRYAPPDSKIMTNSLYLRSMIEPNDWLESAMLASMKEQTPASANEVSLQLRCAVLLNLVERNAKSEEVADIFEMAELATSSVLPGYSSRMVQAAITKHRLDDDDGISEALRRICARIAPARLDMPVGHL